MNKYKNKTPKKRKKIKRLLNVYRTISRCCQHSTLCRKIMIERQCQSSKVKLKSVYVHDLHSNVVQRGLNVSTGLLFQQK